jgi:trimeric autotransporter adhesin
LKLLPLDQIKAEIQAAAPRPAGHARASRAARSRLPPAKEPSDEDLSQRAADGFLINGSSQNGAASPFAQLAAFGNNRNGAKGLYNGGIGVTFDNSALDAQQFSLTGQNTPKPAYNRLTGLAALGGPVADPHLFKRPRISSRRISGRATTTPPRYPALMPDLAERNGLFASPVIDPGTGAPFPGNLIPQNRISPQALALLSFYPLPNFNGNPGYNYQIPILSATHQDALQSRFNKTLGPKDQIYGRFAFQSLRSDNPNLFGFLDTTEPAGDQHQRQLVAPLEPGVVPEPGIPVQPAGYARYALLRKS